MNRPRPARTGQKPRTTPKPKTGRDTRSLRGPKETLQDKTHTARFGYLVSSSCVSAQTAEIAADSFVVLRSGAAVGMAGATPVAPAEQFGTGECSRDRLELWERCFYCLCFPTGAVLVVSAFTLSISHNVLSRQ